MNRCKWGSLRVTFVKNIFALEQNTKLSLAYLERNIITKYNLPILLNFLGHSATLNYSFFYSSCMLLVEGFPHPIACTHELMIYAVDINETNTRIK